MGSDVAIYAIVALALVTIAVARKWQPESRRRALLAAAIVTAVPAATLVIGPLAFACFRGFWRALGHPSIGDGQSALFEPNRIADTAISWYGPVVPLLLVAGTAVVVQRWRSREAPLEAVVFAVAPLLQIGFLAVSIVHDPFRGRFLMCAVALATVSWGLLLLRSPVLTWSVIAIAGTTMTLSLVHSAGKPSGLRLIEADGAVPVSTSSIWGKSRVDTQMLLRSGTTEEQVVDYVSAFVPGHATVALTPSPNDFLSPYFGADLSRTVELVRHEGGTVPDDAGWLVLTPGSRVERCRADWRTVFGPHAGWAVLRRTDSGSCAGSTG